MTKREVLTRLNVKPCELAKIFSVSTSAIAQWKYKKPIPRGRWFELKYKLRPDVFGDVPDDIYAKRQKQTKRKAA